MKVEGPARFDAAITALEDVVRRGAKHYARWQMRQILWVNVGVCGGGAMLLAPFPWRCGALAWAAGVGVRLTTWRIARANYADAMHTSQQWLATMHQARGWVVTAQHYVGHEIDEVFTGVRQHDDGEEREDGEELYAVRCRCGETFLDRHLHEVCLAHRTHAQEQVLA